MKSLVFLFYILLFCISTITYAAEPPLPAPVGRVVWVNGDFQAVTQNKEQRKLQKLSVIYLHDTLITDGKSRAQIVFTDNTLMTFRPATKFYVTEYSFDPKKKTGSAGKYVMNLMQGGFRTITGIIAKNHPSDYKVNTPVATIGVRGTDYSVNLASNGELYIGFDAGEPCVTNKGGEICLDKSNPFARVKSIEIAPVPQSQRPDVLMEQLEVVPAKIAAFSVQPGVRGSMSSFCIVQ